MKNKKIGWFVVAVLLCLVAYGAMYPENFGIFGICSANDYSCVESFAYKLGEPLFFISLGLLISVVALFFANEAILKLWQKITIIYFLVALLITTLLPITCHGWFCFEKENTAQLLGGGLFLITLILIISKKLKSKSGQN